MLGAVPTQTTVIAERFFDEGGGMQLVIHAPFGGRINKAWGLALRKRFCRGFNFELQAAATDNGLNIALAEQHSFPLGDVFHFLQRGHGAADSGAGGAGFSHFRHALALGCEPRAGTAALSERQESSAADSAHARRMICWPRCFPMRPRALKILRASVRFPIIRWCSEVMKDVLTEAMDVDGLKTVLRGMAGGEHSNAWPWIRRCHRSFRMKF